MEDLRELDNGDQLAKIVYTLRRGKNEKKLAERLTLTELEGHWKVVRREMLQ